MRQTPIGCRDNDKPAPPSLPAEARLPINRCNLPAVILGGLTFQHFPAPLHLDGVREVHGRLFALLDGIDDRHARATLFTEAMAAHFLLDAPAEAGWEGELKARGKMDYRRLLRGWSFDPDGREAAIIKGWVESRFGLIPRHHGTPITAPGDEAYLRYLAARTAGLYNTNALEAQLDLLFTYGQYELVRCHSDSTHLTLYRGVNRLADHEVLEQTERDRFILLLNNINSFTRSRERAEEFGDHVLEARIPLSKIAFYADLLPQLLRGEDEYMVLGGVYEMRRV
ncbi:MAG: NAD(+)--dinitrogen-reductase ADP-D-ribosyltransferase [Thiohalomonadaceae bacterium]